MDRISNLWLTFLLKTRIKRIDFQMKTDESKYDCCGPRAVIIIADYKWFWEKSTPSGCC